MSQKNQILKKYFWIALIPGGCAYKFIFDIIFGLIYRDYSILQPFTSYLVTLLLFVPIGLIILGFNSRIDRFIIWNHNIRNKFLSLLCADILIANALAFFVRWVYFLDYYEGFIRLSDEFLVFVYISVWASGPAFFLLTLYLLQQWKNSFSEIERFKKENAEFQFEMLKAQINPHFLFNSLNTLSSLVHQDQDLSSEYIRQMSKVYRYVLENRSREVVPLTEELTFLEAYRYLLELRFKSKLSFQIRIDLNPDLYQIAPMTIQLLVENSVKHNVVSQKKPLTIELYNEGNNFLVVKNTLQPKTSGEDSTGMGLENISNRYSFLTSEKVVVLNDGQDFIVKIPLLKVNI